ncbi:MAG: helix-turn-helix domain-containing protein [Patescibacteria group bacterium]
MSQVLIFILGVGVGGGAVWFVTRRGLKNADQTAGPASTLIGRQAEEKKRNKEALLGILETQTPLTNNHVEQLLGVSDATATRYLEELEKEGKVRQVGTTGQAVYYEKI